MQAPPINEQELEIVLDWIDSFSFTRPKKNLSRDFSDGVLVAEIMKNYFPQWVQLHNYSAASSASAKYINWKTLNEKIFKKLNFSLHKNDIENIIGINPGCIEKVLFMIYCRIKNYQMQKKTKQQRLQNEPLSIEKDINSTLNYAKQLSSQLVQKDQIIKELRDTVLILQQKLKKMQQLNKLKDTKIESLIKKVQEGF